MKSMGKLEEEHMISWLQNQPIVKRNLCKHTWVSGGNTTVYPITLCQSSIELQWNGKREPKKWIESVVKKFSGIVKYGYFSKTDGSCPSYVCFELKEARY